MENECGNPSDFFDYHRAGCRTKNDGYSGNNQNKSAGFEPPLSIIYYPLSIPPYWTEGTRLAEALRRTAREALPRRAFLRRDRGDALFVSDAPRLCPGGDWGGALASAGFLIESGGGLLRLRPGPTWLRALEARFPKPPDDFSATLVRFAGVDADAESLALFALGARRLDCEPDGGRFEKKLRQRAAECLRLNRTTQGPTRGGGLYACALLRYIIEEE